ncbi:MAG TPA: glycosyltransferase family 9 protein [bacterium]|nr:glycosyltransferase family 9 protein [bacterium]
MKKILIWRDGAFGDTILLISFLKILKNRNYYIRTISNKKYAKLFFHFNLINENIDSSSDELLPLFSNYSDLKKNIFEFIFNNDYIIIFTNSSDSHLLTNLKKHLKKKSQLIILPFQPQIKFDIIFNDNILKGNLYFHNYHIIFHFFNSLNFTKNKIELIKKNPAYICINKNISKRKKSIVIHIGSGSKNKNISIHFWIKLIKFFLNKKFKVNIIGSYAEEKEFIFLQNIFKQKLKYHFDKDIIELTELISSARLFIGNDSGPGHLSAILKTPTIIFCKNSNYKIWHQIGIKTFIIKIKE